MSDVFGISVSALQAFQNAINVTSNNVANANTPGYDRETVNLAEAIPQSNGTTTVGAGVTVTGDQPRLQPGRRQSAQYFAEQPGPAECPAELQHADRQPVRHHDRRLEHLVAELLQRLLQCRQRPNLDCLAPGAARAGAERGQQFSKRQRRAQCAQHGRELPHHRGRAADQFRRRGDRDTEQTDRGRHRAE